MSWAELNAAFAHIGDVDVVVANAGVIEPEGFATDTSLADGTLNEPSWTIVDVNICGEVFFVKLASARMRKQRE